MNQFKAANFRPQAAVVAPEALAPHSGTGAGAPDPRPPLVVDLDGTLTPTDTLVESVVRLLKQKPLYLFALLFWLVAGRARLKERLAELTELDVRTLPWRTELVSYLEEERRKGRRIVLATAAHSRIAQAVAAHLGLFDQVLATEGSINLKGTAKLAAIRQQLGSEFVYVGDSSADLPIWAGARGAVLVGTSAAVTRAVRIPVEHAVHDPDQELLVWLRALRVHQWIKNALLFVPLLTGAALGDMQKVLAACSAFLAFSLSASATYLCNDLWDLDNDRQHPRKRHRPFASGRLSLMQGMAAAAVLMFTGLSLALAVAPAFAVMLACYIVLTTAYSMTLKQYVLLDVITLAMLYTWRVLAGSVAVSIEVTPWLLAFSVFTFLSLALVKRCSELVALQRIGMPATQGRDYQVHDLAVLWPLGVGASLCAVVVFGLYIGSPGAESRYANTQLLWLVGVGLMYWIARLWIKTVRGEMHDDPIIFVFRDRGSRLAILSMVALTLVAQALS